MGAQLVGFNPKKEIGTWSEINLTKVRRMKKGKLQGKTDTGLLQRAWRRTMKKAQRTETLIWMMKLRKVYWSNNILC
jgi:hypothetical protein